MSNLDAELHAVLGRKGWKTPPDCEPWQRDWLDRFGEEPLGVALPGTASEVAKVIKTCLAAEVSIVPQGGNTSLVGGSVSGEKAQVILSLSRMDKIGRLDVESATVEVEAGVILARLHEKLENTGLQFPMHLGAEGSAQIGGLISTNAGGSHAFRYGLMQDLVLGLEVVLPNGAIWNGMRRVQKDNAGYQLRKIFCGAEGTLGVVTKAVLGLVPEPMEHTTGLLAVRDLGAASRFASQCRQQAGEFLSAIEFFSDVGLAMALDHVPNLTFPLEKRSPTYVLVQAGAGSSRVPVREILTELIDWGMQAGLVHDGVLASSEAQRTDLWRLREEQPEGQRLSGPQLKHDVSVPPALICDFIDRAATECETLLPGVRINAFGHLGDGNIHYNLSPPSGRDHFSGLENTFAFMLGELAGSLGGSFAAEHGLGRAKNWLADRLRDPVERDLMRAIKRSIDESGLLNPSALL